MTALYNHDYAAAVEAYDQIENLDANEHNNYMKAYYLRAKQLIDNGNFSAAVPCLKAASYYADKHTGFGQLSRYWLAEAKYKSGDYEGAREGYNELYNLSALDRADAGDLLTYNIAYCYFKQGDYDMASKWFSDYIDAGKGDHIKDAMVRKADCSFIQRDYKTAEKLYDSVLAKYDDPDDVYPYYQDGLAYGLSGDNSRKASTLSRVLKASPDAQFYPDAMYELARTYVSTGDSKKAIETFRTLRSTTKDSSFIARADLGLGMVANNDKRYDDAITYYKKVVEEAPESEYAEDAVMALQSVYQSKGEPEAYLAYIDGLKNVPAAGKTDREKVYFNSAEQVFLAGNYQKAIAALNDYLEKFPEGKDVVQADFYLAESYRMTGEKEQARDCYRKVIDAGSGSFAETSARQYASICYDLQEYQDAFDGYTELLSIAKIDENKHVATVGAMESAYQAKGYVNAISYADKVLLDTKSTADEKRLADYIKAKSYLARSERDKAFEIFSRLSNQPKTAEGAEAAYMEIQDAFDKGDFESVENRTFAFSDSGTSQTYWLAKAFITLGDSYVERGDVKQAKATFESVRDGYTPQGEGDEVLDAVSMRLKKLEEMSE
jgi:tetratricopeptide (TPR) repeat protein